MESIWEKDIKIRRREPLKEDTELDAAVIGGGLCGILTAFFLTKVGLKTAVFEAARIGSGQSGKTTAKITAQHGTVYSRLTSALGASAAREYAEIQLAAVKKYKEIIEENQIDCHFEEKDSWIFSQRGAEEVKREAQCAAAIGMDGEYHAALPIDFPSAGAFCLKNQAQFNPLEFIAAVADKITAFERTRIEEIEKNILHTGNLKIKAKYIIHASHFTPIKVPGWYFIRMYQERSCLLALENAPQIGGMFLCTDPESNFSLRNYENYLLFGGAPYRTGKNKGGAFDALIADSQKYFPGSSPAARWSAQDGISTDSLPYIGRFSKSWKNHFIACGFRKWGMTNSMAAAMIISSMILGEDKNIPALMSPSRKITAESIKNLIKNTGSAASGLGKRFFYIPSAHLSDIAPGEGGIITHGGRKKGVYKAPSGELFFVSPRCEHMGCMLEWNPDELTWDCPCHGSRYDIHGNLIDSPSNHGLPKLK